jgi:hypothetical protein
MFGHNDLRSPDRTVVATQQLVGHFQPWQAACVPARQLGQASHDAVHGAEELYIVQ